MSRKEIQIETNFYNDDNTQLFKAELIEKSQLTAKSASSAVHLRKSQPDASINSYRYQYVPDNEYSHSAVQEETTEGHSADLPKVQKLQAAYQLESFLSGIAARLFINCWQTLKSVLPQYNLSYRQVSQQATYLDLKNEQVLKDFSNNENQEVTVIESKQARNQLNKVTESAAERKRQILQRQKRGITLDSLQKQRELSRTKLNIKVAPQKDMTIQLNNTLAKQKVEFELQNVTTSTLQREQQASQISQKSYRQKFEQYKQRNQSKEQRDKFIGQHLNSEIKYDGEQNVGTWEYIYGYQGSCHNYLNTNNQFSKHTQSHSTNYGNYNQNQYISSSYPYANFTHYNQLFSYRSPIATNLNSARSNYHIEQNVNHIYKEEQQVIDQEKITHQEELIAEHQWIRARLLEEITEKLNFSRLRLETRDHRNSQDLEMIRKIARLEKLVMELKRQQSNPTPIKSLASYEISNKLQEEQILFKKFIEQMSSIRLQLNQLKIHQQPYQPNQYYQDDSARIITQQQSLLNNYQQELKRLLQQKQQTTHITYHHSLPQPQPQPPVTNYPPPQPQPAKNFSQSRIGQKVVYKQVLFDGRHQAYDYEQREVREQEIRRMTERVRRMRGQQVVMKNQKISSTFQERSLRPIRERYQHELERLQKQRDSLRSEDDDCCVLIKY